MSAFRLDGRIALVIGGTSGIGQAIAEGYRQAGAASCGPGDAPSDAAAPVSLERGRRALQQYACSACHMIPGITGAEVHVGPPLAGIASRRLIAGALANTPENLERWLVHTQQVKPGTAMPQLGVTQRDARDMAGYLGELR